MTEAPTSHPFSLPKRERLYLKKDIGRLLQEGRYGTLQGLKYSFAPGSGVPYNRMMVSVPKKLFKRAVKRNLLKRRLREAYRTKKYLLEEKGVDIMFIYGTKEVLSQAQINSLMESALGEIGRRIAEKKAKATE